MSIKARMYVKEFREFLVGSDQTAAEVTLQAVNRKTSDNIDWSAYSPSGTFSIVVTQKEGGAFDAFRSLMGKDVLIDITPAPVE